MTEPGSAAIRSFEELNARLEQAMKSRAPLRVLLLVSQEERALRAMAEEVDRGWIRPILVGDRHRTAQIAEAEGISLDGWEQVHRRDMYTALKESARMAAQGEVDLLMKGDVPAHDMLQVLLRSKNGYRRSGEKLTHVGVFDIADYPRMLLISDGGVMVRPSLEDRIVIIQQAASVARMLGVQRPRVALLAAVETVSEGMPVAMESAALAKMGDRRQLGDLVVDGPLSLDVSVSAESAAIKGVESEVAGRADIIVCPRIEVGNTLYKAMVLFAEARAGAIAVGTRCPIVMPSRSENHGNRLHAIETAMAYALFTRGEWPP